MTAPPRTYYRITDKGLAASEDQVRNPLVALYPMLSTTINGQKVKLLAAEYFKKRRQLRMDKLKEE